MARYIDADELKERADKVIYTYKPPRIPKSEAAHIVKMFLIDDAPTADVAPVVHGKWNTIKRHRRWPDGSGYEKDYCSVCRFCGSAEYAYCPWCGARMGEKGEGESK